MFGFQDVNGVLVLEDDEDAVNDILSSSVRELRRYDEAEVVDLRHDGAIKAVVRGVNKGKPLAVYLAQSTESVEVSAIIILSVCYRSLTADCLPFD